MNDNFLTYREKPVNLIEFLHSSTLHLLSGPLEQWSSQNCWMKMSFLFFSMVFIVNCEEVKDSRTIFCPPFSRLHLWYFCDVFLFRFCERAKTMYLMDEWMECKWGTLRCFWEVSKHVRWEKAKRKLMNCTFVLRSYTKKESFLKEWWIRLRQCTTLALV